MSYFTGKKEFKTNIEVAFNRSSLSKFWAKFKFGNKIDNLVNIQQSIKNFILIIPEIGRKTRVQFNYTQAKTGWCARIPGGFLITLDPHIYDSLKDTKCSPNDIVNIYSGLIFHEISHALWTKNWETRTPLWGYIYNVIEDNRIEYIFSETYPNLSGYIKALHDYMFNLEPEEKKEKTNLDKIICTFYELIRGEEITDKTLTTPSGVNVYERLYNFIEKYEFSRDGKYVINMSTDVEKVIMELLHDFKEELPKELSKKEMQDLYDALPDEIKKKIEKLLQKVIHKMEAELTDKENAKVKERICIAESKEDFKNTNVPQEQRYIYGEDTGSQDKFPSIVKFSKPSNEMNVNYREIVTQNIAVIQRLRNNFEALLVDKDVVDPNKLSGKLDKRKLFRGGFSDRLFQDEYTINSEGISAAILMDESGSMGDVNTKGGKANICRQIAIILIEVLLGIKNVELEVYSFTGDGAKNDMQYLYGAAVPHKCSVMNYNPGSSNYDHIALWQTFKLLHEYTKNNKKLIFIISDGQPCGHGYGGTSALDLVKNQVTTIQSKGVPIIQIAIDNATTSDQMYTNWVFFKDYRTLTVDFIKLFNVVVRKSLI